MYRSKFWLSLLTTIFALPLILYVWAAWFLTRLAYDDFCEAILPPMYGYLGGVKAAYEFAAGGGGRLVTFVLNIATSYLGTPIGTFLIVALVILWWTVLYSILSRWLSARQLNLETTLTRLQAALGSSLLLTATISSLPNIHMALFTHSGYSGYLTPSVFSTVYVWYLTQPPSRRRWALFMCGVAAFITASASETAALALLLLVTVYGLFCWQTKQLPTHVRQRLLIGFVAGVIGFAIFVVSPATMLRRSLTIPPDWGMVTHSAMTAFGAPVGVALLQSPLIILAIVLVGYSFGASLPVVSDSEGRRKLLLELLSATGIAYVSQAVLFAPVAAFLRTGLIAHAWLPSAYIFILWLALFSFYMGWLLKSSPQLQRFVPYILVVCAVVGIMQAWQIVGVQRSYAAEWDARDSWIRQQIADGRTVPPTTPYESPYFRWNLPPLPPPEEVLVISDFVLSPFSWEAEADPRVLTNVCMSRYYHVAAISVVEQ
jgi:hypothetical protein